MGNAGRVITAVIADLVIGGFGYMLLTATDLDAITKGIGMLICLIALTAVTNNALGNKPTS